MPRGTATRGAECYALIKTIYWIVLSHKFVLWGKLLPFKWGVRDERKLSITARAIHSTGACCGGNLLPFKWSMRDERKLSITACAIHSIGVCCGGNLLPFKWGVRDERKLSISECAINSADELVGATCCRLNGV